MRNQDVDRQKLRDTIKLRAMIADQTLKAKNLLENDPDFFHWVTAIVLPILRKDEMYVEGEEGNEPAQLTDEGEGSQAKRISIERLKADHQYFAWVTGTVLPAIWQDGGYVCGEERVLSGELSCEDFSAKYLQILDNKLARRRSNQN